MELPICLLLFRYKKYHSFRILFCHQHKHQQHFPDKQQKKVIVHTGDKQTSNLSSEKLGTSLGTIAKAAAQQSLVKRIIIAGGDTSSYAARAMEIDAVEMIAPFGYGAPLCKAISANKSINGLEVNFKGGQVGSESYFVKPDLNQ